MTSLQHPIRRVVLAVTTVLALGGLASPALAADSAQVAAEVTMAAPCLVTNTPFIDFGVLTFSPQSGSPIQVVHAISYVSCSDATEVVHVRGTDATGPGGLAWSLGSTFTGCPDDGLDRFGLSMLHSDARVTSTVGKFETLLGQVAAGDVGAYQGLALRAPCAGSSGAGWAMSFQIIFTASF